MINNFYLLPFIALNLLFLFFFEKIKIFHLIKDIPNNKKKIHKKPVPLAGGLIIFFNLCLLFLYKFMGIFSEINLIFYIGCFLIFILGFIDDKIDLSYSVKFIFLSLIFSIVFFFDTNFQIQTLYFETLDKRLNLNQFSFPVTILCILLFSNALNMFDGINLQTINFSLITIFFLVLLNPSYLLIVLVISLIILFFLNFKNKLFLGNSGSYLISFIISYFLIFYYNKEYISSSEEIFILLILPGIDMLRLFIERLLNRKNPFKGDTNHYHHILLRDIKFFKTTVITIIIILTNIFFLFHDIEKIYIIILNLFLYFFIIYSKKFRNFLSNI